MATKTRQLILDTAQRLFNERGIDAVSVGNIATEMKISKGNITYYFAHKQDIIEGLITRNEYKLPISNPQSLEDLVDMMMDSQDVARRNVFYFKHYTQVAQESPMVREMQKEVYDAHTKAVMSALDAMEAQGHCIPELYPGQRLQIADGLFLTLVYWIPFSELKEAESISPANQCIGLISLILTDEGHKELLRVVKKYPEEFTFAAAL